MSARADAHLHLFEFGFSALLPAVCRRRDPSEATLYDALAKQFNITHGLVVGYEGLPDYAGNNDYLARVRDRYAWLKPVAFAAEPQRLTVARLEELRRRGFVGISMYPLDETDKLQQTPSEVWRWLTEQRWLLSVNARGSHWEAWRSILECHPELRLLISHLGLPPAQATPPAIDAARQALASVLDLARFPGPRVKLSAFYAFSQPSFDYPHRAAFPYVEQLLHSFGAARLLWGSDFSPSLEHVSFSQTLSVLEKMDFLSSAQRQQIEGENLIRLLGQVVDEA